MTNRFTLTAAALLGLAAAACDSSSPADPNPEPVLTGAWAATHVSGAPVPDAMYIFDPDSINGQPVSVHFVVDSAKLAIETDGRYTHRIWVSHWVGEVGGPPLVRTFRFSHGDFGEWHRDGTALSFESHWLQNHTMTGSFGSDGIMNMQHGFSHGDPPVAFRYGR